MEPKSHSQDAFLLLRSLLTAPLQMSMHPPTPSSDLVTTQADKNSHFGPKETVNWTPGYWNWIPPQEVPTSNTFQQLSTWHPFQVQIPYSLLRNCPASHRSGAQQRSCRSSQKSFSRKLYILAASGLPWSCLSRPSVERTWSLPVNQGWTSVQVSKPQMGGGHKYPRADMSRS